MKCGINEMVMRPVTAWKCAAEEKIDAELEAATDPELGVTRTERIKTTLVGLISCKRGVV